MAISEEKLESLKAQFGSKLFVYTEGEVEVAFRKPSSMEYRKHLSVVTEDKGRIFDSLDALVRQCVVSESRETLELLLEEYPGLTFSLGGEILSSASPNAGKHEAKKA